MANCTFAAPSSTGMAWPVPSCVRSACPSHITQRKKAPKQGKAARKLLKRKREKDEVKQEVSKHRKLNDGSKLVPQAETPKDLITNYFKKK